MRLVDDESIEKKPNYQSLFIPSIDKKEAGLIIAKKFRFS